MIGRNARVGSGIFFVIGFKDAKTTRGNVLVYDAESTTSED